MAGAVLLDTRSPESFASGHLRGSINVGLDGRFAEYAGDVVRLGNRSCCWMSRAGTKEGPPGPHRL